MHLIALCRGCNTQGIHAGGRSERFDRCFHELGFDRICGGPVSVLQSRPFIFLNALGLRINSRKPMHLARLFIGSRDNSYGTNKLMRACLNNARLDSFFFIFFSVWIQVWDAFKQVHQLRQGRIRTWGCPGGSSTWSVGLYCWSGVQCSRNSIRCYTTLVESG